MTTRARPVANNNGITTLLGTHRKGIGGSAAVKSIENKREFAKITHSVPIRIGLRKAIGGGSSRRKGGGRPGGV